MKLPQKRRGVSKYGNELKIAIAREYYSSDLGYGSLGKKYNIPTGTVQDFVEWYRKKYPDGVVEETPPDQTTRSGNKELEEANLKITALQMLIENASKELGVDLVKKFGTKQQGK